jgi:DNA polymerase I-like protein with 3'-5' exonuclease and polymerase domains
MLIFDTETDGLLDEVTKIHILAIKDTITGVTDVYRNDSMRDGLKRLEENAAAGVQLCGHNVIKYDIPVIQKLYPWFKVADHLVVDTIVLSRFIFPDMKDSDNKLIAKGKLTNSNWNSHSLDAWGERLGNKKAKYDGGWAEWNQDMEDYCVQDISTTETLAIYLLTRNPSVVATVLEHRVAFILARQERFGFLFDAKAAAALYSKLVKRKLTLEREIRETFAPLYVRKGKTFVPKKDDQKKGYVTGAHMTQLTLVQFNPGSRDQIARLLVGKYGWKPVDFTDGGKPQIDDEILQKLSYAEAKPLAEYFMVEKRIAQVAEGDKAWMKLVKPDGRMHGAVNTNGAVTGRMTHSWPNMAQVPAGYSPYGEECRACFCVPEGKLEVGADASALELRDLAGYMAYYDGGSYITTVVNGKKSDGTEIHSVNMRALGLTDRDVAKTWFYAFIYGAGDEKLGMIVGQPAGQKARNAGKASRAAFMRNLPALGSLVEAVKSKVKKQGYLVGADGRILHVRSEHSALNTLLQSAGAVQMKLALVILDDTLQARGYTPGIHYEFVANVHDEWQIECNEEIADEVGKAAVEAIRSAGQEFDFKCPLDGEYKVGRTWAQTH